MYYLVFNSEDHDKVSESILPFFKSVEIKPMPINELDTKSWVGEDVAISYLNDEDLIKLLEKAAGSDWSVGILPHPNLKRVGDGLGISSDMEDAVKEILEQKKPHPLDMLYCNDKPVFQAVSIGEVFALDEEGSRKNFFTEVVSFLKKIRKLGSLSHTGFTLFVDEEKVVKTSALGIVSVAYARGSVVARRLIDHSAANDGFLHAIVLAPQNILTMIGFMLRSLIPFQKILKTLPDFMGLLTLENLKIDCTSSTDFTIDGEKHTSEQITLSIRKESLKLVQESKFKASETYQQARAVKIENLPTGEKRDELIKYSLPFLPRATADEFKELFSTLRVNAQVTNPFVVMMILSAVISTFGLFGDSSPVIIGAMILAPLMSPIVSFSMGVVRYDVNMLKNGIKTILIGTAVSLLFAALVSIAIPLRVVTSEMAARLSPTLLDLGIALASGVAAAYAHAKEEIAKTLAGVAIAVALVPPLAVAGIGIGWMDWDVFSGAFLLYLTNLAGIIMLSGLTFLLLGFAPFRRARAGLIYTLIIIVAVCIPLTFSFNQIMQEAQITEKLEGKSIHNVVLNDVRVRFGKPPKVNLKVISPESLKDGEIQAIKAEIEAILESEIRLEVVNVVAL
jgi:uncharacterized hydrophobic protein (TIGR00271 family)